MTDVTEHSEIDLDLKHIIEASEIARRLRAVHLQGALRTRPRASDADTTAQTWRSPRTMATRICTKNGQNSSKTSGLRTLMGFASGAAVKCSKVNGVCEGVRYEDNVFISKMNAYWKTKGLNEHTWGAEMIDAAFLGTAPGATRTSTFQRRAHVP